VPYAYNHLNDDTDRLLSTLRGSYKPFLFVFSDTYVLFEQPFSIEAHWSSHYNGLLRLLQDGAIPHSLRLVRAGGNLLNGLRKVLNYYSADGRLFNLVHKLNFLYDLNDWGRPVPGLDELQLNLISQLLGADRWHSYQFLTKPTYYGQ
jgi:hypothetical protein